MNSSGIKRGLAVTAITALAVTGVPAIASATPLSDQVDPFRLLSTGNIKYVNTVTANDTISLVSSGPAAVTSVTYQYSTDGGTTYTDVPGGAIGRDNGAFSTDFDLPGDVDPGDTLTIQATANTGTTDDDDAPVEDDVVGNPTIELDTPDSLGIYTDADGESNVAVRGTTSDLAPGQGINAVNVFDNDQDFDAPPAAGSANGLDITADGDDEDDEFEGVLVYPTTNPYNFSPGGEANEVALTAAIGNGEDTKASTYYVQDEDDFTVTADPDQNPVATGGNTDVTVTVLDDRGAPVAGAEVILVDDEGTPANLADDTDITSADETDANGEIEFPNVGPGTYTPVVDSNSDGISNAGDTEGTPFTITEFEPENTGLTVEPVEPFEGETDFDVDEIDGGQDDFVATLVDQNGNPVQGETVEYSFTIDPDAPGPNVTTPFAGTAQTTDADGQVTIPFDGQISGAYTLNVRRPNGAGGSGLLNGTPFQFNAGESEIEFDDGASANSPVNGTDTYSGNLSLTNAGGAPLDGREVTVTFTGAGDAALSADQPAGSEDPVANEVIATTDANGDFSVSVTDPAIPANVDPTPESGTLNAVAEDAQGGTDVPTADAEDDLIVNFQEAADVDTIEISAEEVFAGEDAAPGKPFDLDIVVTGDDGDDDPATTGPDLLDQDVTVEISGEAFLSPDAGDQTGAIGPDDLTLDEDNDDEGDLFGVYEDLGQDETVSTDDDGVAGIVAAIERDEDFDEDGLVDVTVTVTSGDVTETIDLEFDSSNYLNLADLRLERDGDEAPGDRAVPGAVDFQLFAEDQFGNLAGDVPATVADDTPLAEVTTDGGLGGDTLTDFLNDNAGIRASSTQEVLQTITARIEADENLVGDDTNGDGQGDLDEGDRTVTESASVNWVAADPDTDTDPDPDGDKRAITARLFPGKNNGGRADRLKVKAPRVSRGATVKLFKVKRNGNFRQVAEKTSNRRGNAKFKVNDRNGRNATKYKAQVKATQKTKRDRTNGVRVR